MDSVSSERIMWAKVKDNKMRPTAHFHISLFILGIIFMSSNKLTWQLGAMFIICSVVVDLDFLGGLFLRNKNHRQYLTHSILFWILIGAISLILSLTVSVFFYFILSGCLGIVVHLLFDLIDWGLPILPFNKYNKMYLGILKVEELENYPNYYFAKKYWSNKIILSLELLFFCLSIFGWIFVPFELIIVSICLSILVYGYFVTEIVRINRN